MDKDEEKDKRQYPTSHNWDTLDEALAAYYTQNGEERETVEVRMPYSYDRMISLLNDMAKER